MGKAKHVGKNLDNVASEPRVTTDIEPAAEPVIVNAIDSGQDSDSGYKKNDFLESIYAKRNKQVAESFADNADASVAPPEPDPDPASIEPSPAPDVVDPLVVEPSPQPQPAAEPVQQAHTPSQKYTIIVDGNPIEYTLEELQQQAQLGVAARKRFEEAARIRQEAEALVASRNSQPQSAAADRQTQQQSADIPDEELRDIAKRMNFGSEEEQVEALRKAAILFTKAQGRPEGPTPEQLVNVATQNALNVLAMRQEQDLLKKEFPDIVADPPLAHATDLIANQLAQKYVALGQPKSRLELLREAGAEAKRRYLPQAPAQVIPQAQKTDATPAAINVNQDKIERKRTVNQPPAAASAVARNNSDASNSGASPEQVVHAMRRKAMTDILQTRGQPVS